jgi:hypothetical protein
VALVADLPADWEATAGDDSSPLSALDVTHSPERLAELTSRLEAAELPYVVEAGTALALLDNEKALLPHSPSSWEARLWVAADRLKEAKAILAEVHAELDPCTADFMQPTLNRIPCPDRVGHEQDRINIRYMNISDHHDTFHAMKVFSGLLFKNGRFHRPAFEDFHLKREKLFNLSVAREGSCRFDFRQDCDGSIDASRTSDGCERMLAIR